MNPDNLSDLIVEYQRKHSMNDAGLAFASHLAVEKIHGMKTGEADASEAEISQLLDFIQRN
ncbi:hypothetical protein FC62_GL000177 [Amylolactobacillus amylotrophicus DSM 20534]|uniref:Uncharacterized protein n=3 Tax=Amylolactobacillus TaxID=2767876 RepID=A0A1L6X9Z8_9LACO|nr:MULTISPECIES: LBP_cg2779 family protein [Amylolactobacillus]APT17811.1 hypothetical protein LA20533_00040 [Amylolactobacillus amylophilus DSM 20533 = JCM 1125]APT19231.1 hypothetical protein LA20533_08225 [Amylolactobacillus amylophilus DSM 20533 = JCM 1125]KRK38491.1 hypothetical protein FC62_GL000177 [Amylolactobacillus amylotrophicus DSM 20534]KRM42866.1 hypothetical protein FD40_GL000662 [Amylolactobacillus amylophilus DSM 20533 = JCM 1125]GED79730.1 hypothetical protein LAM01_02030 [Am